MNIKFEYGKFQSLISQGKVDEAFAYRAEFTPDYLYKFVSLVDDPADKGNKNKFYSLENNSLWFATPAKQNDPYEFRGVYWEDEELLKQGVLQQSIDQAKELLFNRITLTAFTANMIDNLPMWAHYANNHHGFCIKYRVGAKHSVRNVIYDKRRVSVTKTFLNFLYQAHRGTTENSVELLKQAEMNVAILQDKFFYKHTSWEYECEYRALYPVGEKIDGLNVPINDLGLSVEAIYSGINCSEENKNELSRIASVLGVPHKECVVSSTDFTVFQDLS